PQAESTNGSKFGCSTLTGGYTRVGTDVEAVLGGYCSINSDLIPVMFAFRGEFLPNGGTGLAQPGISEPITSAQFAGTVVIMPV
ncbi:MAG: hypothetical protein ACYCO3_10130, partial [Mycobacteriales bacterium]